MGTPVRGVLTQFSGVDYEHFSVDGGGLNGHHYSDHRVFRLEGVFQLV